MKNIKLLTANELKDVIDEQLNQVNHLERSQMEIKDFLEADSNDQDFVVALAENEDILTEKQTYISTLKAQLKIVDPVFYIENYGKNVVTSLPTASVASYDRNTNSLNSGLSAISIEEEKASLEDTGIYL
jgi:hypothetical protein